MVGKSWRQELETAAHIVFTVKKQAVAHAGTQLAGFVLFSQDPRPRLVPHTFRVDPSTSVNLT